MRRMLRSQVQKKPHSSRTGSALVEVAVSFPIFMLILLGIIEFGRALSVSQSLNNAAREGCRAAIVDGSSTADVQELVLLSVVNTVGCRAEDVDVDIAVTSDDDGSALSSIEAAQPRDLIQIDIRVPYSAVSFAVAEFLKNSNLRGSCVMRHE